MRTIQYDMILSEPYRIDRIPDIRNHDGIPSAEAIKLPGMRMIVEECEDLEKFFANFDYCCVDNFHPKFERQSSKCCVANCRSGSWIPYGLTTANSGSAL